MKRALVSLLGGVVLLAILFVLSFYAGDYRQPRRGLIENLGDHLFMLRSHYRQGMSRKPPQNEKEVEKALRRLDPRCHYEVRELAAWRLGTLGEVAASSLLREIEALASGLAAEPHGSERRFRLRALIRGIAALKLAAAVPQLLEILESDDEAMIRFDILECLGEIGDPAAIPSLGRILESPHDYPQEYLRENERQNALEALARIGGDATPLVIEEYRRSSDPQHLDRMCPLLAQTRDRRAADVLVRLARHPNADVRLSAVSVLDQLMGPAAVEPVLIAIETEINDFIRAALIRDVLDDVDARDPQVYSTLRGLVGDPAVGDYAVRSLGRMGGREAVEALVSSPKGCDPIWVMENLDFSSGLPHLIGPGMTGEPATTELLTGFLDHNNPEVRRRALNRLVVNGDPGALPAVEKHLSDPDEGARDHARNAALTLAQWASLDGLLRFVPNATARHEIRSEFDSQYITGFTKTFLDVCRVVHRWTLVASALLGILLVFNAIQIFEPYRFTLLPLLFLFEGFVGDFWWTGGEYYLGELHGDNVGPYETGIAVHIVLLLGFILIRPERGGGSLPRRFGRLGGASLWVLVPSLLYFGVPIFSEAFRKAASNGLFMVAFFGLLAFGAVLAAEEYLVPWALSPRSARTERTLLGILSAGLMLLLAYALGRLGRDRWLDGNTDGATICFLLALPLASMFVVYIARIRPFETPTPITPVPPPPPGSRLRVRLDGETLSIQLPGPRLLPASRIQIRGGYVRRARTLAGAALLGGKWGRRLSAGGKPPDLDSADQAWLRGCLGHDPISSPETLIDGLKLEVRPFAASRSENRIRLELLLTHDARRPWSLADLEQAANGRVWQAVVDGRATDLSFVQRERELALAPRRTTVLHPRTFLPDGLGPTREHRVFVSCLAGGRTVSSEPMVLEI